MKSQMTALILCFLLGAFGAHRFYVGKPISGIFQILTLGGLGFWAFYDLVMIIMGKFTDKNGNSLI
jgi:TM2 domain-containing membrane protein YozV